MSIRTKVMGCFVLILALFMGVAGYNYRKSLEASERLALVNELFLPLSRQVAQIQTNLQGFADDVRRYFFQSNASSEGSSFSRVVRDLYPYLIQKKFALAEQLLSSDRGEKLQGTVPELLNALTRSRQLFDQMSGLREKEAFEQKYSALRAQLQSLSKKLDEECQQITAAAQREGRDNLISSLCLSAFLILSGFLTLLLTHRTLSPLPMLIGSLRMSAEGDFQPLKLKGSGKDEVGILAREYNRMLSGLKERDQKIQLQQKELLANERLAAVGQLSAEVVHEIRNPLNSISLNIDWLEHELSTGNEEIGKTLRSISHEIERLHQITESYLARARVPSQGPQQTDVNELIQEILNFERGEIQTAEIAIEKDLTTRGIFIRSDRARLKQAFLNVIKNAKEAMPRGGVLKVRTEVKDNVYRIQFSDTGYGMNDSTKHSTAQPFFTTKPNGTGLGLVVTRNIVEEAHGTLTCESRLGEGTTFTFQFPV